METATTLLEELTRLPGIPGHEKAVVDYLMGFEDLDATHRRMDDSGNVWIECEGPEGPPLVLVAHMDEVGMRVKRVEADGRLSVIGHTFYDLRTLGGEILTVWTEQGPRKVFLDGGQQTQRPKDYANLVPESIRLDLGVVGKEAALALGVQNGDPVTFDDAFHRLEGGVVCAKAFDDRSGLAAHLRALQLSKGRRKIRPVLLGTVQEEIGGHGADAVEFPERPGAVINVDICGGEVYSLPVEARRSMLGAGPIMHDGPEISRGMLRRLVELAERDGIPLQRHAASGRGADQSVLQKKCGGLPIFGIILPMAFYHAPRGLIHPRDVYDAARLISAVLCDEEFLSRATKF